MNIVEKIKKLLPYIVIIVITLYIVPLFAKDTGSAMLVFLFVMPAVIFMSSLIYGIKNKFCGLLAIVTAILTLGLIFFFDKTAWIYTPIYFSISLIGTAIGTIFNKQYTILQAIRWFVGIVGILLFIAGVLIILSYGVFKEHKSVIVEKDIPGKHVQSQCQDFTFQQDYLCSYDAGIFSGDKDLSFDNKKANAIREKTKNNRFNKNWEYIPHNELSYPSEDNLDPNGKFITEKNGYTVKVKNRGNTGPEIYVVIKDGKEIYHGETLFMAQEPFKNFVIDKNGDWWFLYNENLPSKEHKNYDSISKNILVHNGEVLDYEDVFELQEFDGKVFYFFEKNKTSKIHYYFDGKIVETDFSEIIHDRCCESGRFNIRVATDGRMQFWGIVGENFNYNEFYFLGKKTRGEEVLEDNTSFSGEKIQTSNSSLETSNPTIEEKDDSVNFIQQSTITNLFPDVTFHPPKSVFLYLKPADTENPGKISAQEISSNNISFKESEKIETLFLENGWYIFPEYDYSFGEYNWNRGFRKDDFICNIKMESQDGKKGDLTITCGK